MDPRLVTYWGLGLLIQYMARRQATPKHLSTWRIVSMVTWEGVRARPLQIAAGKRSVQMLRGLPKA
jgi:hypothetical protein